MNFLLKITIIDKKYFIFNLRLLVRDGCLVGNLDNNAPSWQIIEKENEMKTFPAAAILPKIIG